MVGPAVLLLLGGVLGDPEGLRLEDFEVEAQLLLAVEPQDPKCFSRRLHDVTCFWDHDAAPDPHSFSLLYSSDGTTWLPCPLSAAPTPGGLSRFWCQLPPDAVVLWAPLELQVLPQGPPNSSRPLRRTISVDRIVLLGPPQNVSAVPGGVRGQLCVRWDPPPSPHLENSLIYELQLSAPGLPPRTVPVPVARREQRVASLRGSTRYRVRLRTRPDGISYSGYWSPWSDPASAVTPSDLDPVTLGLSCLLVLLLLALGLLALLGHRRKLKEKLWPPVPGPEREFEGLFSAYGGNFQLWLCQGVRAPWTPPGASPEIEEPSSTVEEVGPPPGKGPPPTLELPPPSTGPPPPSAGPSPSSSFEYTLFDPGSALLCPRSPPADPPDGPYANLAPQKGPPPDGAKWAPPNPTGKSRDGGDSPHRLGPPPAAPPQYVLCS